MSCRNKIVSKLFQSPMPLLRTTPLVQLLILTKLQVTNISHGLCGHIVYQHQKHYK